MTGTEIHDGLAIQVLGPFSISIDGAAQPALPKKAGALMAYLARRPDVAIPRESLAALLWADSAEEQARASLRQSLSGIRRALEHHADIIDADTKAVRLAASGCRLDVSEFERLAEADPSEAVRRYGGAFLEGCGSVTPEFDNWAEAERRHLEALQGACLLKAADQAEGDGRLDEMIDHASRLLLLDPLQEHVHRRLMRALLRQKRYDAALRQFNELTRILSEELGVAPEKATLELVAEVKALRSGRRSEPREEAAEPGTRPNVPGRPSVAVLPFRAHGGEDAAFLGEGIAEDVIIELARNRSLMTVARQSSFRFSEDDTGAEEIGRQLGVRFLLGGSVRVAGDRARITAHLIRCEDGREIWAERFDRELADIFEVQIEIARTVTATVVGQIEAEEISRSGDHASEDLGAHLLVLRASREIDRISRDGFETAISLLERAVTADPRNARARGMLALCRIYLEWHFDIGRNVGPAIDMARSAVEIDPREPKAHCALGVALTVDRRFDEASHHFQAGMSANPNDAQLLVEYGRHLMYVDRPEAGIRSIREAMRLNPFHPSWYWSMIGRCLHTLGQYEEAIEAFRRMENPPFYVYGYLASCLAMLGDEAGAEVERERLYAARPDFDLAQFASIFPYKNPETAQRFFATFGEAGIS